MKSSTIKLLVAALAGAAIALALARVDRSSRPAAEDDVLAVVGGSPITRAEVRDAHPDEFLQVERQMHDLLQRSLDRAIRIKLIEMEAAGRGVAPEELLRQEVDETVSEPTEEEVSAFYEERKDQIRGSKEDVAPQIRQYLQQKRWEAAYLTLIATLEERHGVENKLEPPRIEVAADGFPARGPADAPVTIVEFGDFECPFCYRVIDALDRVRETYGDQVRLVYRQFPLNSIHPYAQKAAEASLCADAQGKFWEMHDAMFENQRSLGVEDLKATAVRLGLDGERFDACLDSGEYRKEVAEDLKAGVKAGVGGTPALFINGRFLSGAQPYEVIARIVDDELRRTSD